MTRRRLTLAELEAVVHWDCEMSRLARMGGQRRGSALPLALAVLEFEERDDALVNEERHLIFTRSIFEGVTSPDPS